MVFPDIPGYQSLLCDLHTHSVFSDGSVWPDIRVREALKDGLDVLSLTEHLEYQPHADDIPHPDRNRSYELAREMAAEELLIVHGSEVTRGMPPGHLNAIFITDANRLLVDDVTEALREAKRQGAFIFWNHPHSTGHQADGIARLTDMHRDLIADGLLNGIEVINDLTYSDEALQIALDHNLTILGTSDIHGLVDWRYEIPAGGHRPISIVFATERTESALREALFAGRTIGWSQDLLVGKAELLSQLASASLSTVAVNWMGRILELEITNNSSALYLLRNLSDETFHDSGDLVTLPALSTTRLRLKVGDKEPPLEMEFEILNAIAAPRTHPRFHLHIPAPLPAAIP